MRFGGVVLSLLFLSAGLYGQDVNFGPDPNFEPAKIITTPTVTVPKEAIESGLGGTVRVLVSIDEAGNVTSADDANGPGAVCSSVTRADVVAMRNSAKKAALLAKFSPATRKGKPETSTMWLNFTYPSNPKKAELSFTAVGGEMQRYKVVGEGTGTAGPPTPLKGTEPSKTLPGGVFNGKALSLPKPPYPAAARAVRASGSVSIQVLIDENGEVFSAEAVSGHPLLRGAAKIAACGAKFMPTRLSGEPVKVSGIITYNFVP